MTPKRALGAQREGADGGVTALVGEDLHAVVAHDLRGPLAAITGFGLTLAEGWDALDDDLKRSMVRRMTAQASALQAMTENLLAARSLDLDRLEVDLVATAPGALLADLAEDLAPIAGDHPLRVEVEPRLPDVLIDRDRLAQVLVNLVGNAAKHSPRLAPIGLRARSDGGWVAIEVCDRGPGIPREHRARVFDKHVRLAGEVRGLGLGLFIADAVVRAMGGSIAIDDVEGGGACVVCRFRTAGAPG